ncbi:hypothetical protein [Streptomyces sp. NBC_00344]|uniref:hypothetical protein n=1 Tax=Streptomyces sp. NBC_00344 TaxID=2975720 RepID=UPI002E22EFE6
MPTDHATSAFSWAAEQSRGADGQLINTTRPWDRALLQLSDMGGSWCSIRHVAG